MRSRESKMYRDFIPTLEIEKLFLIGPLVKYSLNSLVDDIPGGQNVTINKFVEHGYLEIHISSY